MLEILTPGAVASRARVVLFDFDGTLSLIRSGWMDVMAPMMVQVLQRLKTGETEQQLAALVREFIYRLNGKQTIYQMMQLAEEVRQRGGTPEDPLHYKHQYLDLLWQRIRHRVAALESGAARPNDYLVPGSMELIRALKDRGLKLYLASGTDEVYMKREADLLGLTPYFDGGVFGALDDYTKFEKDILIRDIIHNAGIRGDEFLAFGDGYVEIQNVKEVGGVAVGVATDEKECLTVDAWKRDRLAQVGADYIIPNYLGREELFSALFAA
ncbi:MAG TPA: HAD family hydrolase [Verrucomicrobiae bacterium]|nr:HAD family hydrolase [Verrucomicrobiae bacterium]